MIEPDLCLLPVIYSAWFDWGSGTFPSMMLISSRSLLSTVGAFTLASNSDSAYSLGGSPSRGGGTAAPSSDHQRAIISWMLITTSALMTEVKLKFALVYDAVPHDATGRWVSHPKQPVLTLIIPSVCEYGSANEIPSIQTARSQLHVR